MKVRKNKLFFLLSLCILIIIALFYKYTHINSKSSSYNFDNSFQTKYEESMPISIVESASSSDANTQQKGEQTAEVDIKTLEDSAIIFTKILINHSISNVKYDEAITAITDDVIYRFIFCLNKYRDENYIYSDIGSIYNGQYIVPIKQAQKVAFEVFGNDAYSFSEDFDTSAQEFKMFTDVGTLLLYQCKDIKATANYGKTQINVTFELEQMGSLDGNPNWVKLGTKELSFYIITNKNQCFLRLITGS